MSVLLQLERSVPAPLHRLESNEFAGPTPSAVRNVEYGIDDDDLTIVPTPAHNFTAYGLSLFLPKHEIHLWNRSMFPHGRCFQFVEVGYTLPEGLAVVYDGEVRLKCWDGKEDRLEKRSGREQFRHYSLVTAARMSESEYRIKLSEAFSMPQVMPCRILAGAEKSAEVHMPEWRGRRACVDGEVLAIADAAELYIETAKLLSPAFAVNIILLYQLVTDDVAQVSFAQVLASSLWSRTAFHLLGLAERVESHNSRGVRYLANGDTIAARHEWDPDVPYGAH
ncbi:hypothetical protein HDU87_006741 [Geranomyces variabilis]|uniref:Uncharacterized protein n=1 Tax=Geranomyces variabilis TaxID=109894 RepID=A0AAD5TQF6_9FUNG|nr:hypothetical protein HDU87_006741 [Geranomyces variabilis]